MVTIIVPERFRYLAPAECKLTRLGRNRDGGYIVGVESLESSLGLISLGISSEWSFDSEFLNRKRGLRYVAVDRSSGCLVHVLAALKTIRRTPLDLRAIRSSLHTAFQFLQLVPPLQMPRRRKFVRRWVRGGVEDRRRDITIKEVVARFPLQRGIFVKMDVEGAEYELLPEVVSAAKSKPDLFSGMCVEFHDVNHHEAEFHQLLRGLLDTFDVVHIHANNCVALDSDFPQVVEITLARKMRPKMKSVGVLPNPSLDFPNDPSRPDYRLVFG